MPRKKTGTLGRRLGKLYAVVSHEGQRPWLPIPEQITTEAQARKYTAWLQAKLDRGEVKLDEVSGKGVIETPPAGETFGEWVGRWLDAREARKLASVKDDRSRMRTHVLPLFKDKAMADITTADLEALVAGLDKRVQSRELSWKTARNVWGLVSKAFKDAKKSKLAGLRVRTENIALDVAPPDLGVEKVKTYLYPSEFLALMHCDRVPLRWKRLIALAVYIYPRTGEMEALECEDIEPKAGLVTIHRSVDRYRNIGEVKGTKTGVGRTFAIEPAVLPLVRTLRREASGIGRLVKMPPAESLSPRLRQYLRWAGCLRAALHADVDDPTRKRMTWYDLRATGLTWRAIRGDDPLKIQRAAGHADLATTQLYIREAEAVRGVEAFGEVFPPLSLALLGVEQ